MVKLFYDELQQIYNGHGMFPCHEAIVDNLCCQYMLFVGLTITQSKKNKSLILPKTNMGSFFSRIRELFGSLKKESRVAMIGLDAAGKTTITNRLYLGETVTTVATIGFSTQSVEYKNLTMTIWDVGGQKLLRPLWKHFFQGVDAIIYVVDSSDKERLEEAEEELHHALLDDSLRDAVLLVYANKMDLPGSISVKEMAEAMGLSRLRGRTWHIQGATATNGEGLYEGLDFIVRTLNAKK